jgi:hypothetical protein
VLDGRSALLDWKEEPGSGLSTPATPPPLKAFYNSKTYA